MPGPRSENAASRNTVHLTEIQLTASWTAATVVHLERSDETPQTDV